MEVPRLGVESELLLLAYTIAEATPDPSHVYNLHQSSQQNQILSPLSKGGQELNQCPHGFVSAEPQQELQYFFLFMTDSVAYQNSQARS